ncbi:MAG: integrase arm-type DNA-binding domain-containing protein [Rhodobacteraceae bacterium]|jgi:integrase|nr:integrase arm-type DNA-binding domain-containing protein [Paracoccaceae bacterium]MCZ8082993.1 integrase arm-type DNA-binding domain-containing protein [Paracoccaceae bacterium]
MPKRIEELSALDVKRLSHPGEGRRNALHSVGGVVGLFLQVTPTGGKSWVLRVTVGTKRRDIGLGSFPTVTLAQAREKARAARDTIEAGRDPVEERKAIKAALAEAQRPRLTFTKAMEKALAARLDAFKSEKHRKQWQATLDQYAVPIIGSLPVDAVDTAAVLRVLSQEVMDKVWKVEGTLWNARTVTATRLRQRIEAVLTWATVAGHRSGDNPARWAGNLKELLPAPGKIAKTEHHPALALEDASAWFSDLRKHSGFGVRALEFAILTGARSDEVRGATWDEINLDAALWIIPAIRMKMGKEHRVPLASEAIALLKDLPKIDSNQLVFPAARGGELSDMTLSATMRRMHKSAVEAGGAGYLDPQTKRPAVPHGLRSTFRDWVSERTSFPGDMAEVALAHKISNAVEAAYRRGDMVEKRRAMMAAWADFLKGIETKSNVVRLK